MITLEIPGEPVPWRVARGRAGNLYNPSKEAKDKARWLIGAHYRGELLSGAVKLDLAFFLGIPKSVSYSRRRDMLAQVALPTVKPDLTNLQKFYEDCLTGIVFADDCQVTDIVSSKRYSDNPRTVIGVLLLGSLKPSAEAEPLVARKRQTAKLPGKGKVLPFYESEFDR